MKSMYAYTSLFVVGTIADGGYTGTCQSISLVDLGDNHIGLRAYCDVDAGAPNCNILDLDHCYAANGGNKKLYPASDGNLSGNCKTQSCELDGSTLKCHCKTNRPSSVETSDLMSNDNGTLKCFNHLATTPADCALKLPHSASVSRKFHASWFLTYASIFLLIRPFI